MKTKLIITAVLLASLLTACEKDTQSAAHEATQAAPESANAPAAAEPEQPSRFESMPKCA